MQWAGAAEEVEVLELLPNDFVRIRWLKWGPSFDQTLPRLRCNFPPTRQAKCRERPALRRRPPPEEHQGVSARFADASPAMGGRGRQVSGDGGTGGLQGRPSDSPKRGRRIGHVARREAEPIGPSLSAVREQDARPSLESSSVTCRPCVRASCRAASRGCKPRITRVTRMSERMNSHFQDSCKFRCDSWFFSGFLGSLLGCGCGPR